jgi:hypothetical protein
MLSRGVGYHDLGEAYLDQISDRPDPNRRKPQAAAGAPWVSIQPKEAVPNPVEAAA